MMRMDSIVLRCIAVCAGYALVAWSLGQGRIGGWGWLRAGQTLALCAGLVMLWRGALRKSPRSAFGPAWLQRMGDFLPALLAMVVFALVLGPMLG